MGSLEVITVEDDFTLLLFQNDGEENFCTQREVQSGLIQFHFGLKGKAKFIFNQGNYALDLKEEKSLLLYNPQKELPLNLEIEPNSWVISVIISIQKFHSLFSSEANYITFLSADNKDISEMMHNLEEKGGEFYGGIKIYNELLKGYSVIKLQFDEALKDMNKELTYTNMVTYPSPSDKKAYPIRSLIVLVSVVSANMFLFVVLVLIDSRRKTVS